MIPYLLGIAGGYLIGSARELFAKGGGVGNQDTDIPTIEITKVEPDERGRKTSKVKYNVNYQITIDENLMEIEGMLIPYDSGRDEEHRFEPGYFMDSETEEYFYDNFEKIETEILNKFSTYFSEEYANGGEIVSSKTFFVKDKNSYEETMQSLILEINKYLSANKLPILTTKKESDFDDIERLFVDNATIRIWDSKNKKDGAEFRVSVFMNKYAKGGSIEDLYTKLLKEYYKGGYENFGASFKSFIETKKETALENRDFVRYNNLIDVLDMYENDFYAKGGGVKGSKFNVGDKVMVNDNGYVKYFSGFDLSKPATIIEKGKVKTSNGVVYFYGLELADGKKPFNNAPENILTIYDYDTSATALSNYSDGGGIEMLQELWYVTDNEGKVKNISTSKEKAELFLADKLKYSGNINYVKVPLSEWMGEKVNVGNIKQYAKSLWQNYAKGGNIGEYTFYVKDKQGKVIFKSKRLNKTSDYIVTNNLKDVSVIAIDKNGNEKVLQGGNQLN
jgi:hypothetical protein